MNRKSFTLVEIIVYLLLLMILLSGAFTFFAHVSDLKIKSSAFHELTANMNFATQKISSLIMRANAFSVDTEYRLTLTMPESNRNPTVISAENKKIIMQEGTSASAPLTSKNVNVDAMTFIDRTAQKTPGTIQVSIAMSNVNPSNRQEFHAELNTSFTANLRIKP